MWKLAWIEVEALLCIRCSPLWISCIYLLFMIIIGEVELVYVNIKLYQISALFSIFHGFFTSTKYHLVVLSLPCVHKHVSGGNCCYLLVCLPAAANLLLWYCDCILELHVCVGRSENKVAYYPHWGITRTCMSFLYVHSMKQVRLWQVCSIYIAGRMTGKKYFMSCTGSARADRCVWLFWHVSLSPLIYVMLLCYLHSVFLRISFTLQ